MTSKSSSPNKKLEDKITKLEQANVLLSAKVNELNGNTIDLGTVPLEELALALYIRFGIYTAFCGEEPADGDVSPLTAQEFTRYEQGHAYQLYKRSRNHIDRDFEADRQRSKVQSEQHKQLMSASYTNPSTPTDHVLGEKKPLIEVDPSVDKTSYEYRTSVHGDINTQAGEVVSNGETVAAQPATEAARREAYRQQVADSRVLADAEARARDYAARTHSDAFEAPVLVDTPVKHVEGGTFTNDTVKKVLEAEGLSGEVVKEPDLFGQRIG